MRQRPDGTLPGRSRRVGRLAHMRRVPLVRFVALRLVASFAGHARRRGVRLRRRAPEGIRAVDARNMLIPGRRPGGYRSLASCRGRDLWVGLATIQTCQVSYWARGSIVDYYDFSRDTIQRAADRLSGIGRQGRHAALSQVAAGVERTFAMVPAKLRPQLAISMVEDLYKSLANAPIWSGIHTTYVWSVWGTAFAELRKHGHRVEYFAENDYESDLVRPLQIYPEAFRAAGFIYACPQYFAWQVGVADGELPAKVIPLSKELQATVPPSAPEPCSVGAPQHVAAGMPIGRRIDEGRMLAGQIARDAATEGRHLAYVEAVYEDGALDIMQDLEPTPGTIVIFRNEAPVAGSKVNIRMF